jgi:hypothetical protein
VRCAGSNWAGRSIDAAGPNTVRLCATRIAATWSSERAGGPTLGNRSVRCWAGQPTADLAGRAIEPGAVCALLGERARKFLSTV